MLIYSNYKLLNFYNTYHRVKYNIQNVTLIITKFNRCKRLQKLLFYPQSKITGGKRNIYLYIVLLI